MRTFNGKQAFFICLVTAWAIYCCSRAMEAARAGVELHGPNTAILEEAANAVVRAMQGHPGADLLWLLVAPVPYCVVALIGWYALADD